jgi:phospholipase/carboxylesterase
MKQGKPVAASLQHVVFFPTKQSEKNPTIFAIHGRGTDENDLVPLVHLLGFADVLLVAPRAPFPFPFGGFAWYDLAQEAVPEPETFLTSLDMLRKFIEEVKVRYPVNLERLLLLGFSQGTVMAYATGLLNPTSFRGIAALSGYVPHRSGLPLELTKLQSLSVFISHGTDDAIIPVRLGRESAELLKQAGAGVTYREYPMGHEVSEDTIHDLNKWASNIL